MSMPQERGNQTKSDPGADSLAGVEAGGPPGGPGAPRARAAKSEPGREGHADRGIACPVGRSSAGQGGLAGGLEEVRTAGGNFGPGPGGKMPPWTAGETPAATKEPSVPPGGPGASHVMTVNSEAGREGHVERGIASPVGRSSAGQGGLMGGLGEVRPAAGNSGPGPGGKMPPLTAGETPAATKEPGVPPGGPSASRVTAVNFEAGREGHAERGIASPVDSSRAGQGGLAGGLGEVRMVRGNFGPDPGGRTSPSAAGETPAATLEAALRAATDTIAELAQTLARQQAVMDLLVANQERFRRELDGYGRQLGHWARSAQIP